MRVILFRLRERDFKNPEDFRDHVKTTIYEHSDVTLDELEVDWDAVTLEVILGDITTTIAP